jgi:hypothetical protein
MLSYWSAFCCIIVGRELPQPPSADRNASHRFSLVRFIKEQPGSFALFEPCVLIYLCNKNQQNSHFLHHCFNLTILSTTCSQHPSVHPQKDLYVLFSGISFMYPHKQSGQWQGVLDTSRHRPDCLCCIFDGYCCCVVDMHCFFQVYWSSLRINSE